MSGFNCVYLFLFQGHMCAYPEIYGHLTHLLMPLAKGKLCVVLEACTVHRCKSNHTLVFVFIHKFVKKKFVS